MTLENFKNFASKIGCLWAHCVHNYVGIFDELVDLLVIAGFGIFREQSDRLRGLLEF